MTKKTNLPAIFFLLAGSISAFIAAYLVMNGQHLSFGNVDYNKGPLIGYEVWGLGTLLALITLCLFLLAAFCLFYQAKFGHSLAWWKAVLAIILAIAVLITFYPLFDFQYQHYQRENSTSVFLEQDRDDSFTGNSQHEAVVEFDKPDFDPIYEKSQSFLCVEERNWWWGKLRVTKTFYPVLGENKAALLKQFCKPITEEEAFKRGTGS